MSDTARPNLLYLHSDQHSPFVLGCAGDPLAQTPNLDALAARGVVLDAAYCPSPICVPSRMSSLTGRYPHENRVWTNSHILDSSTPTLAHAMGAAGYRPALVGRMHSVGPDQLHGYAERLVGDHGANHIGGVGADHGMLAGTAGPARVSLEKSGPGQSAYQVHDEDVTAATVHYLDRLGVRRRSGQQTEPFSLTVGFMLPHQPFVARRRDYDLYAGRMTMPRKPEPFSDDLHPFLRMWRSECGIEAVSDKETLRARTAYWALVTRLDALIGQILEALERNGLADNTLIVYSSDHGEQVGEHGLWWKQTFYEESVRVPAILSWPGVLPQGQRCGRVVSALDLNATILAALDAPPLPRSRGRSLLPLLTEPAATAWDDVAYSEFCLDSLGAGGPTGPAGVVVHRMVRRGPWKLCYYRGQRPQLFNLDQDPDERRDRAADESCAAVRNDLTREVLNGWDPEWVAEEMAAMRRDHPLLAQWARQVRPPDQCRWDLRPEMDYLD